MGENAMATTTIQSQRVCGAVDWRAIWSFFEPSRGLLGAILLRGSGAEGVLVVYGAPNPFQGNLGGRRLKKGRAPHSIEPC